MTYIPSDLSNPIRLAEDAAERLFGAKNGETPAVFEPPDIQSAYAATRRLSELFDELPGAITSALGSARDSAELLSSDRLQGLAEIIQNADDVEATEVRIILRSSELRVSHNGNPVRLRHVLGLATPWLSTKGGETATFGRFGIGLMTLRSLSEVLEVHCHPYHVRLGDPTVSPIASPQALDGSLETGWTTFRIPLTHRAIDQEELEEWLARWDHSALLFLRHVESVSLIRPEGGVVRKLSLSRKHEGEISIGPSENRRTVSRERVTVDDGRSWTVYAEEVPAPAGFARAHKATGETTPITVALPKSQSGSGRIHAGLPVTRTRLPIFANAQFDPLASREGLADNDWNDALYSLVAELWSYAALDLFSRNPQAAWQAVPIAPEPEDDTGSPVVRKLEKAVLSRTRNWLAAHLSFDVPGQGQVSLSQLAVEAPPLERILTENETASIADLPATLPAGVRDHQGRWRSVLQDWRIAGADLPEPVSVSDALVLIADETRTTEATIALVATAIDEGLQQRLFKLPCVIASDGRRIIPPRGDSPEAVATKASPLAEELGVITLLHPDLLGTVNGAPTVLKWLAECGALVEGSDDRVVVHRLAAAGRSGRHIETPLTDGQVQALREAFEHIEREELRTLGPDVGRAVLLEAYQYDANRRGRKPRSVYASAPDAYLPKAIERGEADGFAVAAEKSPGLLWLSDRYARVLRLSSRHGGMGAQRFFRLLGAETAPRLCQHSQLVDRYALDVPGLPDSLLGGPPARQDAMRTRRATYTLNDRDCPELTAVVRDIARVRNKKQRRKRANALLATLGRAWDRLFGEYVDVESAQENYGWKDKRPFPAYWIWEVQNVSWLDDESGTPRRPPELRVRTPGTVAIYGEKSPDFLHPELSSPSRRTVLSALGISGDPSRSDLLDRLKGIRDDPGENDELTVSELKSETGVVYKALAETFKPVAEQPNLSSAQIRREFERTPGLIYTDLGWQTSQNVFAGHPILGEYRAFAPALDGTVPLWDALSLPRPSWQDCVEVIRRIARKRTRPTSDDEAVLLEAFRLMATQNPAGVSSEERRRLAGLALWTCRGWTRDRPVYATDDSILGQGLREHLPIWEPGGDLEQFRPLLSTLRIQEIQASNAEVTKPDDSWEDTEATDFFRSAVRQLQEELARNDPDLVQSVKVEWERLADVSVHILPSLSLGVHIEHGDGPETYECSVAAKMDISKDVMFVRSAVDLPRADGGGRALATLFDGDPRRLSQTWRVACDRVEEGREARPLVLASERAEQEQRQRQLEIDGRTASFRERTGEIHRAGGAPVGRPVNSSTTLGPANGRGQGTPSRTPELQRILVDPQDLTLLNPQGRLQEGSTTPGHKTSQPKPLVNPTPGSRGPRSNVLVRSYSDLDRENVGFEIVRMLLDSEDNEIADLRTQRGVGADAMDDLEAFYELKVNAGAEPDVITLTDAEVKRALTTPDFFLIVVSGIEGVDARPTVRVLADPLHQLQPTDRGSISLSGVRTSKSLVYEFGPIDGTRMTHNPRKELPRKADLSSTASRVSPVRGGPQTRSIGGTFKFTFPLPKPANEGNTRLHKSKAPKPGPKSRADVAQSKPAAKTARTNITPKRVRLTPEERQERARARAVEARNKLKEAGLCRDCRQRAIPGQTRCPDCAEKHRQSRQAQRK